MDRTPLTDRGKAFLALVMRSPDIGDGWRKVSQQVWPLVEAFEAPDLIEKGDMCVRLTEAGNTVFRFA